MTLGFDNRLYLLPFDHRDTQDERINDLED